MVTHTKTHICTHTHTKPSDLSESIKPPSTEGEGTKALVDDCEETLGSSSPQRLPGVTGLIVLHVV